MEVERIEYRGHYIVIHYDDCPQNPREEFDTVGQIVHWHRRYDFGERIDDPEQWLEDNKDDCIILPLGLLDHSGLHMWVGSGEHWCDPGGWDSGQVGWIYCTKEIAIKEWGRKICTKKVREMAIKYMTGEIAEYDMYLRGAVYGYMVEGDLCDDSCWGYYGSEYDEHTSWNYMIQCAKDSIDYAIAEEWKKRIAKLKGLIRANVPLFVRQEIMAGFVTA